MPRARSPPAPARSSSAAASRPRPAASPARASAPSAAPAAAPVSASHQQAPPAPQAAPASSGGWFSRPAAAPTPIHQSPAIPPALQPSGGGGGGMMAGLMGSVVQGAALGTGSAIAHRAVDSFMGPRETKVVHENAPSDAPAAPAPAAPMMSGQSGEGPCADRTKAFTDCMSRTQGDMPACQYYFDAMQQCRTSFA